MNLRTRFHLAAKALFSVDSATMAEVEASRLIIELHEVNLQLLTLQSVAVDLANRIHYLQQVQAVNTRPEPERAPASFVPPPKTRQ